jgi:uncharacterized protein with HEPN domain
MSKKSDLKRLEFIITMIENISVICKRHSGIKNALNDMEGQNAIFMCLVQIGEKIKKIEDISIKECLPVKEAASVRNFIIHDYTGVDLEIIEEIIDFDLKVLEKNIMQMLDEANS